MSSDTSLKCFGERVRQCRKELGWTQRDLADNTGLKESWVSHFETGRRKPSFASLLKLADGLDVSADFLLGRTLNRSIFRIRRARG